MSLWPPPEYSTGAMAIAASNMLSLSGIPVGVSPEREISSPIINIDEPEPPKKKFSLTKCYCCPENPPTKPPCYACIFKLDSPPPKYLIQPLLRNSRSESSLDEQEIFNLTQMFNNNLTVNNPNDSIRRRRKGSRTGDDKLRKMNKKLLEGTQSLHFSERLSSSSNGNSVSSLSALSLPSSTGSQSLLSSSFREMLDPLLLSSPEEENNPFYR